MNRNIVAFVGAIVVTLSVTACASFTSALGPEAKPAPGNGYVYGRFWLDPAISGVGSLRMGLQMEEQGKPQNNYTIQFERTNAPSMIAVKPGTYVFKKFIYAEWNYRKEAEKPIVEGPFTVPIVIEPGKAYYVADFIGHTNSTSSRNLITHSWRVDSVRNNFEKTTAEFKTNFPNLSELNFVQGVQFN